MKRWIVGTLFVGSLVLIAALGPASSVAVAADGRTVFDEAKCQTCHGVESLGLEAKTKSEAMKGGDLSKVTTDAELLAKYLRKEAQIDDKDHKKAVTLGDDEMAALVDWLRSDKS